MASKYLDMKLDAHTAELLARTLVREMAKDDSDWTCFVDDLVALRSIIIVDPETIGKAAMSAYLAGHAGNQFSAA